MTIRLEAIAVILYEKAKSLGANDSSELDEVIASGDTLIELLDQLIKRSSDGTTQILQTVLDEIFVDLHVSVTLSMGGQYKAACVLLRTFIEISLYVLFFIDHPVEVKIWADTPSEHGVCDMSFAQTLEKVVSAYYIKAASGREPDQAKLSAAKVSLQKAYRLLSERVHGKYAFLQAVGADPSGYIKVFSELSQDCIKNLITLGMTLSRQPEETMAMIPALRRYL